MPQKNTHAPNGTSSDVPSVCAEAKAHSSDAEKRDRKGQRNLNSKWMMDRDDAIRCEKML